MRIKGQRWGDRSWRRMAGSWMARAREEQRRRVGAWARQRAAARWQDYAAEGMMMARAGAVEERRWATTVKSEDRMGTRKG
jgi:hypothetical protein